MVTRQDSQKSFDFSKREDLNEINKVRLKTGVSLEGDALEDYCRTRGLCPLCAATRTRKRIVKIFKKNTWEPLTVTNKAGGYTVYKGYCVKPDCFTLDQAKQLAGERISLRKSQIRRRSVMKGLATYSAVADGNDSDYKPNPEAFPPKELKDLKNLEILDDKPYFVIDRTVESLKQDGSISVLDLSLLPLRSIDLQALSSALKVNTTLSSLIMENCKLDDEKIVILGEGLHEANDIPLTKLYLRTNSISDSGAGALCPFLEASVTLEKLDVSRNCISTMGGVAIFNAFYRNRLTRIRCINLSHNELWDLDEENFGVRPFLGRNRSLKVLNLESNYIHDEGAEAIARGLGRNDQTALERLYLGWNAIGNGGTIALAAMMEVNTSLQVVGLTDNEIGNPGARALLSAMDVNLSVREISGLWRNRINRRFIVIAIRRLLLSREKLRMVDAETSEQSPVENGSERPQSSNFEKNGNIMSGIYYEMSSTSMDPDCADPAMPNADQELFEIDAQIISSEEDDKFKALAKLPSQSSSNDRREGSATKNGIISPKLQPLVESPDGDRFDRLTIIQSAPLAYFDRESGIHKGVPLQDFKHESALIEDSVSCAVGAKIEVSVEIGTLDRFSSFFADKESHVMHFSCYGDPEHIALENGYGSLQTLPVDGLRRLMAAVGSSLRVVIVSSCHAHSIGQAFVDAGTPYVICCQREERFRDPVVEEFLQNLYRALAQNKLLKQAFNIACNAVTASPLTKNLRMVLERFTLFPDSSDDDHFHDIPVFFTQPVSQRPKDECGERSTAHLPRLPQHFLGREVCMYEILEALRVADITKITGKPGNGKDSAVAAVCTYALERKNTFLLDDIFWLPALEGVHPQEDSLYGDLNLCINVLKDSREDIWETNDTLLECRERIEIELEGMQVVLVVDDRDFQYRSAQEGVGKFISHLLNVANAKVILITSQSSDAYSSISTSTAGSRIEESQIEIEPLDFKSTALLFGGISKFILSSGCPVAHSVTEFAELCEPAFVSKMPDPSLLVSQRRSDLFARMGSGFPSTVISAANSMQKKDFIELIGIANRPEVFVDSLGALENEIRRRSFQKKKAVNAMNYLRAMDLDIILEELEGMRPEFPSLEDLRGEEELMKEDLAAAVANRRYDEANDLKRELLALKKKIMKERRLLPEHDRQVANEILNEFQAQVQGMIDSSDMFTDVKQATFAVNCDGRDCSFVIYAGEVYDFQHPSEAMGIVCWTNESCELEGGREGAKLLECGGSGLEHDISSLPIVLESPYGPVRCGTGNAVIIGPEKYGSIEAPCVILTVGPLSPSNLEDVELENESDSLHYIKVMLRSCYRSSLVLAKHAELQALALTLLTTRKTGHSYEETLLVGLQTLVEEVKFSHLRDLHIVASSVKEASVLIAMMSEMGHRMI